MTRRTLLATPLLTLGKSRANQSEFRLPVRSRIELFRGSNEWQEVTIQRTFRPQECALVLCDIWDKHWCAGASQRVNELVKRAAPIIARMRRNGILVIHAPSDTMQAYEQAPQRTEIQKIPKAGLPAARSLSDPPLPIDDSDGGCDTPGAKPYRAWSRQHPGIPIESGDLISDNGEEIYSAMKLRGIGNLFVAGVHTNMCVLNRSFAIRQMTKWGIRCVLIRDLTDAMYDPKDRPFVSHERGTELVIEHIEKYWAPSVTSKDIVEALSET